MATKHHHDHGKDASVPGKGPPVPKEHWEISYNMNPNYKERKNPQNAWDPRCAKDRKTLYNKVNETDH